MSDNICYTYKTQHVLNEFNKFSSTTVYVKDEFLNELINLMKTREDMDMIYDILRFPNFKKSVGKKINLPMNLLFPEANKYGFGIGISKEGLHIVFGYEYLDFDEFVQLIVDHFIQAYMHEFQKKINQYIQKYNIDLNNIYESERGNKEINDKIGDLLYRFPSTMLIDWNGRKHYIPATSNTLTIFSKDEQVLMAMGIDPALHFNEKEIIKAVESTFYLFEKLNCIFSAKELVAVKQIVSLYKKYIMEYKDPLFKLDANIIFPIKTINDEDVYVTGFIYQDTYLYKNNLDEPYKIEISGNNYIYFGQVKNNKILNILSSEMQLSNKLYIKSRSEFEKKKIKN